MYDQARYSQGAPFAPKQILAGGTYTTRKVTILSGRTLIAGSVIGAVLAAASATATPSAAVSGSGGVVGNGALSAVTTDDGAPAGNWRIVITNAAANGGAFEVIKPDGTVDGQGAVGVAYNGTLNFTLADGANDWVEDDYIPIVVSYAAGLKYKLSVAAANDGSQTPDFVLAQDVDASTGDAEALVYETAQLNASALTLGAGHTIASIREGLRHKGLLIDD